MKTCKSLKLNQVNIDCPGKKIDYNFVVQNLIEKINNYKSMYK